MFMPKRCIPSIPRPTQMKDGEAPEKTTLFDHLIGTRNKRRGTMSPSDFASAQQSGGYNRVFAVEH